MVASVSLMLKVVGWALGIWFLWSVMKTLIWLQAGGSKARYAMQNNEPTTRLADSVVENRSPSPTL